LLSVLAAPLIIGIFWTVPATRQVPTAFLAAADVFALPVLFRAKATVAALFTVAARMGLAAEIAAALTGTTVVALATVTIVLLSDTRLGAAALVARTRTYFVAHDENGFGFVNPCIHPQIERHMHNSGPSLAQIRARLGKAGSHRSTGRMEGPRRMWKPFTNLSVMGEPFPSDH